MSTIIIITPPKKPDGLSADEVDGFAQRQPIGIPYAEARQAIDRAEAEGAVLRFVEA